MRDMRERCVLVLELCLALVLVDLVAAAAGTVDRTTAVACVGLAFVVVALCITLLWASKGETGEPTW